MTHHTHHTHGTADTTQEASILNEIHEGMAVYDRQGQRLGTVETIHFGANSAEQRAHGTGPATISTADEPYTDPVTDILGSVFNPNEVPQEVAEKLYRTGFVRIASSGLFASDRYIMPSQIDRVVNNAVYLHVERDELVKRS